MPYINFNECLNFDFVNNADITIIGAGAAGILLALSLKDLGCKVAVIESGHFEIDDHNQQLNEVVHLNKKLENAIWGRKRVIGGTTVAWGGQSLPFSSLDFEKRSWVPMSGWPIDYKVLEKYYTKANSFMKIDPLNYDSDIFPLIKVSLKDLKFNDLHFHVSKWAKQPNFKKLYNKKLTNDINILYNASLKSINTYNESDNVENIVIANKENKTKKIKINKLIIAAGGIESVKIILNNKKKFSKKNGAHSNSLGIGFMEHPCIEIGDIQTKNLYDLQRYFGTHIHKGNKYSIRLSLSEETQKKHKILNASASIMFKPADALFDPYLELKSLAKRFEMKQLINIVKHLPVFLRSLQALIKDRFYYKVNSIAKVALMTEQEPTKASFIKLSNDDDIFGNKKIAINWKISPLTWKTIIHTVQTLQKEFNDNQLGKFIPYTALTKENIDWESLLSDVNHHMGGTRMGNNQEDSVVDNNLKVWGSSNLYICSCSVFPTSSHSNPTLTMLALACRLTEHIKKEMKKEDR